MRPRCLSPGSLRVSRPPRLPLDGSRHPRAHTPLASVVRIVKRPPRASPALLLLPVRSGRRGLVGSRSCVRRSSSVELQNDNQVLWTSTGSGACSAPSPYPKVVPQAETNALQVHSASRVHRLWTPERR